MKTKITRNIVEDFLYWNPLGGTGFPNENIMIGVDFEIGGTYENWGWGVYDVSYNPDKKAYDKKLIVSDRSLAGVIEKAKKHFQH